MTTPPAMDATMGIDGDCEDSWWVGNGVGALVGAKVVGDMVGAGVGADVVGGRVGAKVVGDMVGEYVQTLQQSVE